MDGDPNDLELLVASAKYEVGTLRGDPCLAPLPGKRGVALHGHVLDLLGAVEHRIKQRPEASAPQRVRSAFARELRQSILMLREAYAAMPWLAAVRAPTLNLGSLYLTEQCAEILVGKEVDLVVVPNSYYMYSTTSWPFAEVINSTSGFSAKATRRPIVMNYPLTDSDRLLLHPIFAHELGHASSDEYQLVQQAEETLRADANFVSAFEATETMMTVPGELRRLLRRWIEELLCDHLAIEVMGPAFLWAFAQFLVPCNYGDAGASHPPNTLRIRLAMEHLNHHKWRPYMERVAPRVTTWLDSIASDATGMLPMPFGFLRDELISHAVILRNAAIGRTGKNALDRVTAESQSAEAAQLLERLIMPVGTHEPLEPRSILLGGWQRAFKRHGDTTEGLVNAVSDALLQDLVGKAIEMSVVSAAWPL
jgi:hypothetical protein